jgi:hypothetical protein
MGECAKAVGSLEARSSVGARWAACERFVVSGEGMLMIVGKRGNSVKFTGEQRLFTGEERG